MLLGELERGLHARRAVNPQARRRAREALHRLAGGVDDEGHRILGGLVADGVGAPAGDRHDGARARDGPRHDFAGLLDVEGEFALEDTVDLRRGVAVHDRRPAARSYADLDGEHREAFVALNDRAIARLADRGHGVVRPAHGVVFQFLDDTGTTVSALAERAQMTKQSMAELVRHLEAHRYVERVPDPQDRRAKLVRTTPRGDEVFSVVREFLSELDAELDERFGNARVRRLRADLEALQHLAQPPHRRTDPTHPDAG